VVNVLTKYIATNPRQDTCLIKALTDVPDLFRANAGDFDRQVIIFSDMMEDCSTAADPRTEQELRDQLKASMAKHKIDGLGDLPVTAVVPMAQRGPDVHTLKRVWKEALGGKCHITIETLDDFRHPVF
jgi:hypothetical protein